ncbi:hypothetical protein KP509_06G074800 [Ceratopteris richardii]|uniref:Mitochondrial splicing suppressor 51-like C-terminal domain-containing protein n=1 Tax=Ceratopteris richardii TaxID=49495 RepID=A0A8T2UQM8_CERRI|nr:hypothetical protein KP509_06G074800 [Ceratopteris richardii]
MIPGVERACSLLRSWADYYRWRGLPLDSPVAILLHYPLTLYYSLQLMASKIAVNDLLSKGTLRVHYLGPKQELDQIEIFAELSALFGIDHIHIDFVGPDVPSFRNLTELQLTSFAKCSDGDCKCKSAPNNGVRNFLVNIKMWKGLYHDVYEELAEGFPPDIIFAPNAGLAAFSSWIPTLKLIKGLQSPTVFTDFCEEASTLACKCIQEVLECQLIVPMQINPFRQPMTPSCKVMELPTYSNCFVFGIN